MSLRHLCRRPVRCVPLLVAVVLSASACGSSAPGTAVTQPWTPLPDTVTATPASDGTTFLAMSPDLTKALREQDGHPACWVDRTSPDAAGVCADVPDDAGRVSATFSPDGARYVLFVDAGSAYRDSPGPWIVEASTGRVTSIDLSAPGASGSTPSGSSTVPTGRPGQPGDLLVDLRWDGSDRIIGLTLERVLRIDAGTGHSVLVAPLPELERPTPPSMALAGSTLAVLQGTTLLRLDLATGTVTPLPVRVGEDGGRSILMGVSPDGTRALVSTTDVVRFVAGPAAIIGLADGSLTEIPDTAPSFVLAGGFSPDGTRIVLAATTRKSESADTGTDVLQGLLLGPADASAAPTQIGPADPAAYGPLTWSRTNLVSSTSTAGSGVRMWQLAG